LLNPRCKKLFIENCKKLIDIHTSLDMPSFNAVAVPKNSATSTATTATKNCNPKGGEEKPIHKSISAKHPTTIILGGIYNGKLSTFKNEQGRNTPSPTTHILL
jgi:hypothetical protein